jgi:hypothetical protein
MSEIPVERKNERRFTERYKIPDGLIYYRELKKINWLNSFKGPCVLSDIASNSAKFESPSEINFEKEIELKILSPRKPGKLQIKGKISRPLTRVEKGLYIYVVRFNPFGKGYHYNSYISKEEVRAFIKSVQDKNSG